MAHAHGFDYSYPEVKIQMKVDIITENPHGGLVFSQSVNPNSDDPSIFQHPQIPWLQGAPNMQAIQPGVSLPPMIAWPESDTQSNRDGQQYADPAAATDSSSRSSKRHKKSHRSKDKHGRKSQKNQSEFEGDTSFELSQKSGPTDQEMNSGTVPVDEYSTPQYYDFPSTSAKRPERLAGAVPVLPSLPLRPQRSERPKIVELTPDFEPMPEQRAPLADSTELLSDHLLLNTFEDPNEQVEEPSPRRRFSPRPIVDLAPDTSFEDQEPADSSALVAQQQGPQVFQTVNESTTTTTTVEVFHTVLDNDEAAKLIASRSPAPPSALDPAKTFHDSYTRRSMETLINDPAFPPPSERHNNVQKAIMPKSSSEDQEPPAFAPLPKARTSVPPKPKLRLSKTNVTSIAPEPVTADEKPEEDSARSGKGFETLIDDPAPLPPITKPRLSQNAPVIMEIAPLSRSAIVSVDFLPTEPVRTPPPPPAPNVQNRVRLAGSSQSSGSSHEHQDRSYDSLPSSEGEARRAVMPSNKIFEMYTNKAALKTDSLVSRGISPTPIQHQLNASSNSIDDEGSGIFPVEPRPKRGIYTIPETEHTQPNGFIPGQSDTLTSYASSSRTKTKLKGPVVKQAVIKLNPSNGSSVRSRSSIDSERSSLSGIQKTGSYNLLDMGSEADNLSDYLQGRLTPLGPDFVQSESVNSNDSVVSEASLRADQSDKLYDFTSATQKARSFGQIMGTQKVYEQIQERYEQRKWSDEAPADLHQSNTSISSFGSIRQEPTRFAQVVTRETEQKTGSHYGEAKEGAVTVLTEQMREMLAREEQSLRDKKSAITTAL